jgi:hypothetical protein
MNINDGGQAFPCIDSDTSGQLHLRDGGMSLRDYFAAKVAQSFTQGASLPPGFDAKEQIECVAMRAYEVADAMLIARESKL